MKQNNTMADMVYKEAKKRLGRILNTDESTQKARLAELRHGIGKRPGENPALWGMLLDDLPENMLGKYGKPSKAEWALYDAMTLYALHQQGKKLPGENMNLPDITLGTAANRLVAAMGGTDDDRDAVSRRFNQIALAADIETLSYYLRTFIPLLRSQNIGLDYAMLAKDIYLCQTESGHSTVSLKWGQDYYSRMENKNEEN